MKQLFRLVTIVTFVGVVQLSLSAAEEQQHVSSILIPAYALDGGNAGIFTGNYNYGVPEPVIANGGKYPNTAEYEIDFPFDAEYTLNVRYCAAQSRPVNLFLDDKFLIKAIGGTTGSWQSRSAKWERVSTTDITKGKHRIRLVAAAPCFPHIVSLRIDCAKPFPPRYRAHWAATIFGTGGASPERSILIPSYAYNRSNVKFYRGYICNDAQLPNIVQYDIEFPVDSTYTLHASYAAKNSRPVRLYLDEKFIGKICTGRTGSWKPSTARWEKQTKLNITKGKHTITLIAAEPVLPHIVALRFDSSKRFPKGWTFKPAGPPRDRLPDSRRVIEELATTGDLKNLQFEVFQSGNGKAFVHISLSSRGAGAQKGKPFHSVLSFSTDKDVISELINRAEKLMSDFEEMRGPSFVEADRKKFSELASKHKALIQKIAASKSSKDDLRQLFSLYLQVIRAKRELALKNPLLDFPALIFTKRYSFNSSHIYTDHFDGSNRFGGNIAVLSPVRPDGKVREVVKGLGNGIYLRPCLSFDAKRVLFAYKKDRTTPYHIYEANIDGSGYRQITDGHFNDMDPCYLPDGKIMFTSTRCKRRVLCHNAFTVASLHVMDADGKNIRSISGNPSNEFTPSVMEDGRVLYTRWEYVDKGSGNVQALWTIHPDGTMVEHFFGTHCNVPVTLIDARQIPGTGKAVAIAAPHMPGSVGPVTIVNPAISRETVAGVTNITPEIGYPGHAGYPNPEQGYYKSPYPLSEKYFLVSYSPERDWSAPNGYGIYLLDIYGNRDLIYRDPNISCFDPIPLRSMPVPPIISSPRERGEVAYTKTSDTSSAVLQPSTAINLHDDEALTLVLDVYQGLKGIPRGTVKYLRIMEDVAKPPGCERCRGYGLQNPVISRGGHFAVKKIYGTVPIYEDGSTYFKVPAKKNIYFEALDKDFMELHRMRSFVNFMPGEFRSCIGCHESRHLTPPTKPVLAMRYPPLEITPPPGGVRTIDFARDVQPILDKHCVSCHSGAQPDGKIDLSGDKTRLFNMAYDTIVSKNLVNKIDVNPRGAFVELQPPLSFGSHKSKLVKVIRRGHYEVKLSQDEFRKLVAWIDANAPYYGTYKYSRPGRIGGRDLMVPGKEPWGIYNKRCANCHKFDRDLLVDFTHIEQSRILMAPLSKNAGGWELCKKPIFKDKKDKDYQAILAMLQISAKEVAENPRVDMR